MDRPDGVHKEMDYFWQNTDRPTERSTDRSTDGHTYYRDARTHLKRKASIAKVRKIAGEDPINRPPSLELSI